MKFLKPTRMLALLALLLLIAACGTRAPAPIPDMHTLTVNVTGEGTIAAIVDGEVLQLEETEDGALVAEVEEGTTVLLTATPADQATTEVNWGGDCENEIDNTCTVVVDADTNVSVAFAPITTEPTMHTLTVNVTGEGTIAATVDGEVLQLEETEDGVFVVDVAAGTEVTLTATPDNPATTEVDWGGACAETTGNTCTVTVSADTNVSAAFVPIDTTPTEHTVAVSVTGEGTVTSNPAGIDCSAAGGETCAATFEQGTEVTLTATPGAGLVTDWGGDCADATDNTCTFTVSAETNVSVDFVPVPTHPVAVSVTGEGTVTSNPAGIDCSAAGGETCAATFEQGTEVTLTATPGAGLVTDWGGDCADATDNTCTFTVSAETNVSVDFVPPSGTAQRRISAESDDAEEFLEASSGGHAAGFVHLTSSDLDLIFDDSFNVSQAVGLRFTDLDIPEGATITNAYIQFTAANFDSEITNLQIAGQAAANPTTFTTDPGNITSRTKTTETVSWLVPTWNAGEAGAAQQTPDLRAIVQEIVNSTNWTSGDAMAFIITGTEGSIRRAVSHRANANAAPLLVVDWTMAP